MSDGRDLAKSRNAAIVFEQNGRPSLTLHKMKGDDEHQKAALWRISELENSNLRRRSIFICLWNVASLRLRSCYEFFCHAQISYVFQVLLQNINIY